MVRPGPARNRHILLVSFGGGIGRDGYILLVTLGGGVGAERIHSIGQALTAVWAWSESYPPPLWAGPGHLSAPWQLGVCWPRSAPAAGAPKSPCPSILVFSNPRLDPSVPRILVVPGSEWPGPAWAGAEAPTPCSKVQAPRHPISVSLHPGCPFTPRAPWWARGSRRWRCRCTWAGSETCRASRPYDPLPWPCARTGGICPAPATATERSQWDPRCLGPQQADPPEAPAALLWPSPMGRGPPTLSEAACTHSG